MLLFFAMVILIGIFTACDTSSGNTIDNTITIHGTATFTRNGEIWSGEAHRSISSRGAILRAPPPPPIDITAFQNNETIGHGHANFPDDAGIINWSMEIPSYRLPGLLSFSIILHHIPDVIRLGMLTQWFFVNEIWVNDNNKSINLGQLNHDVIQLSGNLPVTINGQPLDHLNDHIFISVMDNNYYPYAHGHQVPILPNGDWSFNALPQDSPVQLKFRVEARTFGDVFRGGTFRQDLNINSNISIHNNDMRVVFPSFPRVDFRAFTISGTIEFITPGLPVNWYDVHFYSKEVEFPTEWRYEISSIQEWDPKPDANGLIHWQTSIPAFSFPHTLPFWVRTTTERGGLDTPSSVVINSEAGLNNIHLGSFTVE